MARIILIDDSVYKLTKKQYEALQKIRDSRGNKDEEWEFMMHDFLDENKDSYKHLGEIYFDIKH